MNDGLGILLSLVALMAPLALAWFIVARERSGHEALRHPGEQRIGKVHHDPGRRR
jgi:hypothetical protein